MSPLSTATIPGPAAVPSPAKTLTVALAGNPNSGKTTVFNALTGLRQKVANYPGVTVEKKTGRCRLPDGAWVDVIDLPGTYSLISRSPDEQIAMEVLRGLLPGVPVPDVVVVVVDASNLQRNLYLVSQLIELGRPMVVALNMTDVAERRGLRVSAEGLARELGVPVVPLVGHKGRGVEDLKAAIRRAAVAPMPEWPVPDAMLEELALVGGGLAILQPDGGALNPPSPLVAATPASPLSGNGRGEATQASQLRRYQAMAERLLIGDRAADLMNIAAQEPVASLLSHATSRLQQLGIDPMQADVEAHYHWIEAISARVSTAAPVPADPATLTVAGRPIDLDYATPPKKHLTQKLDAILIHKVWGLLIFAAVMAVLFVSVFWIADPMMGAMEDAVTWLGGVVTTRMGEGPLRDLVADGIFAGVGAVVVFVPQIAMLFLFLAVMEDSGYLARAAFLMDRLLSKVGLHGKSFIPMLSSFACAIPGIMATRTIENRKDRLATIFVAPFMSCSARLPVYFLLIGLFFAQYSALVQGGIMFSLYALGIVAAAVTAWVFKRSFLKGPTPAFILEMPTYKLPQLSQVGRQVWTNTTKFVTKAGTTIFFLSVILWAMTYYPRLPEARKHAIRAESRSLAESQAGTTAERALARADGAVGFIPSEEVAENLEVELGEEAIASEQLRQSIAGRFGHVVEPLIRPLGFDWKMGVGLVGAFAAREVFVSTMAIVYNAGSEDETADLATVMRADTWPDGSPVWTPLVAVSLLIWFVLAMQCISTLAIVRRETGGWRWPLGMLLYMNGLAYVICLIVYQVGRAVS